MNKVNSTNTLGGLSLIVKRGNAATFSAPVPDDHQNAATVEYYQAIAALQSGKANPDHFRCLAVMVNICLILAERGFGGEHGDLIMSAFDALHRIQQRRIHRKKFGASGDDLVALKEVAELVEEQGRVATLADFRAAKDEMDSRLAKGKIYKPK